MATIHGIPASHDFRRKLGRTGMSARFKKFDTLIDDIVRSLARAERHRRSTSPLAIVSLRRVRKACIEWLAANRGKRRAERCLITELCDSVHERINVLTEAVFATSRDGGLSTADRAATLRAATNRAVLQMSGQAGAPLARTYDLESLPAGHGFQSASDPAEQLWRESGSKLPLADWIENVLVPQSEDDPTAVYFTRQSTGNAQRPTTGVRQCTPEERKGYEIDLSGGTVYNANWEKFHTGSMKSESGDGWAIFVIDFDGRIYAGGYSEGRFDHSSFLSGAPVLASGEIAVNSGKVVGLTIKHGSQHSGPRVLKRVLQVLQREGVRLDQVAVGGPRWTEGKWFSAAKALAAGGDLLGLNSNAVRRSPYVPEFASWIIDCARGRLRFA